jgi:carboxypeptidase C (cathepsin A)
VLAPTRIQKPRSLLTGILNLYHDSLRAMTFRGLVSAALLLPKVLATLVNPLVLQQPVPQPVEWDPLPMQPPQIDLSSLSSTEFSTLTHPLYPEHQIRIKETKGFCDPTVKAYTGFIDIERGRKHLFFYFFESRRNPDEDDVTMWINGGPGGSSALGLFAELGVHMSGIQNCNFFSGLRPRSVLD